VALREVVTLKENQINSKQDLINVFFENYYKLFPNMPTSTGVLSDIDLMLQLQQNLILAEAQKDDLEKDNRVLKEKIRRLEEEKKLHKSLLSYHSKNSN